MVNTVTKTINVLSNGGILARSPVTPTFVRLDTGIPVPNDGHRYFMVRHSIDYLGYVRNSKFPTPAVANKSEWGTTTPDNRDYLYMTARLQRFFYRFIVGMTMGLLPTGEFIGYYTIKNNPELKFHNYTPGTTKWIYSRMYQDAVWATDAGSFTTGARDYVLDLNPTATKPWQYLSGRPTTGALLRLNSVRGSVLRFDCIDSTAPTLPNPRKLEPWQYYWCTEEHPDGRVERFPHYKEAFADRGLNILAGTPSPLISPGGWLEMKKSAVVELKPGSIWSPYRKG